VGATDEAALRSTVATVVEPLGCRLYDVEIQGQGRQRTVRVLVDREGGIDLDAVTEATKALSPVLDDSPLLTGPYVLEVSSPGVERPLRRPEHFAAARGETVSIKYHTTAGPRRVRGTLLEAGDDHVEVDADGTLEEIPLDAVTQARTVFEWGGQPRPGPGRGGRARVKEQS
jgi:ribosome maturation factor RimP